MTKISVIHVIGGGIIAGVVFNVFGGIVYTTILADAYVRQFGQALPGRAIPSAMVLGFAVGVMAVWLYASIRAQYGPGLRTAIIAAVMFWMFGYAMPHFALWYSDIIGGSLAAMNSAVGLVEFVVASLVGVWLYERRPTILGRLRSQTN